MGTYNPRLAVERRPRVGRHCAVGTVPRNAEMLKPPKPLLGRPAPRVPPPFPVWPQPAPDARRQVTYLNNPLECLVSWHRNRRKRGVAVCVRLLIRMPRDRTSMHSVDLGSRNLDSADTPCGEVCESPCPSRTNDRRGADYHVCSSDTALGECAFADARCRTGQGEPGGPSVRLDNVGSTGL